MDPAQFHHGLTSVSDKEVSQDGRSCCTHMPPDLLKPFDFSLLKPQDKIPDGNASWVAFMHVSYIADRDARV